MSMSGKFKVSLAQHKKELIKRITPVVNVDIVVIRDGKYLIGRRPLGFKVESGGEWLFPGGRMRWDETPQETGMRKLKEETGLRARFHKLITAISDKGYDRRANGVTLYYLYQYQSGEPKLNTQFDAFRWVTKRQLLKMKRVYSLNKGLVNEIDVAIRTQNTTEDEIMTEVDAKDQEIGTITKREAHNTNRRFHRAAHIILFNHQGLTILQQRSYIKSHSPGMWDMPGGHQVEGQTMAQTAIHELAEEMGVNVPLQFVRKKLKKTNTQAEWCYLYYGISDGPYGFDRNEVEKIQAFDCQKLIDGKYKEYEILPHVIHYIRELKPIWLKLTKQSIWKKARRQKPGKRMR